MAAWMTWLAGTLRRAGLEVIEVPGWERAGHGAMADEVAGCLVHHTAGPPKGGGKVGSLVVPGYPSLRVVVEGRPGLTGPLCNLGLTREGVWVVVAAGQAYHAGSGSAPWCPAGQGNSRLIGIEAESTGVAAPNGDWTPAQRTSYPRGVAALLSHLGLSSWRVIGHKEWAPGRKIDPAFWSMNDFRADVARWMSSPTPAKPGGPFMALTDAEQTELLALTRTLFAQLTGDEDLAGPDKWGWKNWRAQGGPDMTPIDYLRAVDGKVNSVMTIGNRPGADEDDLFGHVLSLRAEVRQLRASQDARLSAIEAALVTAGVDPDVVRDAIRSAFGGGLTVTSTVNVGD